MPASNARAIAKARTLECDVVILDLEDAVAPDEKVAARDRVVEAVRGGGFGERELVVRINGLDTPWYTDDIAAVGATGIATGGATGIATGGATGIATGGATGIAAVLVPKVSSVADLITVRASLGEGGLPIWAMIETCAAILALPALSAAAVETRLTALIVGTNDLAKEMRCRLGDHRMPLIPALSATVMAARAAGIVALDGVCNALDDPSRFAAECTQGAMLGFDGKTLIHPSQIDAANVGFGPSEDELAWARRIVEAFARAENADKGAIRLDGQMVERLHLTEAEAILGKPLSP